MIEGLATEALPYGRETLGLNKTVIAKLYIYFAYLLPFFNA